MQRWPLFVRIAGARGQGRRKFFFSFGKKRSIHSSRTTPRIWEKKYGRNANHILKQHEGLQEKPINRHLSPRRKKLNLKPGSVHNVEFSTKSSVANFTNDGLKISTSSTKAAEEKILHPSWEAKKRLKEKQNAAIISSQGTRLTFDY